MAFDDDFRPGEQLPRGVEAHFLLVPGITGPAVQMVINGFAIGDPNPDEAWAWRGAVHVAFAMCLGWSPCLRQMTGIVRRSNAQIAEAEDGPRAVSAEAGILGAAYREARDNGWFADHTPSQALLDHITELASPFEVAARTPEDWAYALSQGFGTLRSLREGNGGIVIGDLHTGTVAYLPTDAPQANLYAVA